MGVDSGMYQKLSALQAQGRPCLLYTDGGIYHVQEIKELCPPDTTTSAVSVRCKNGTVQRVALNQIEDIVEWGGHMA